MNPDRRHALYATATLFFATVVWSICSLDPGVFWITDGGNKFLVMKQLLEHGTISFPSAEFFPDGGFHFPEYMNRRYSIFPEFYPCFIAGWFRVFGIWGLYIPSWIGTALTLFFMVKILDHFEFDSMMYWLVPVLFVGTPLVFYTLTFWEMTLSCAVGAAVFWLLLKRRFAVAGLLLGFGLLVREEMYFVLAAALGSLGIMRDFKGAFRLGGFFALGALPVWSWQLWRYGHILGLHGALYYQHNSGGFSLLRQLEGYFIYLFKYYHAFWLLAGVLAVGASRWIPEKKRRYVVVFFLLVAGAALFSLWTHPEPVWAVGMNVAFFGMLPWAVFALWTDVREQKLRFTQLFVLFYLLLVPPLLTQSDMGIIWGPRHFMIVLPPVLLLAAEAAKSCRSGWLFAALALISCGIELRGLGNLYTMKRNSAALTRFIGEHARETVVSDLFFLPMQTPGAAAKHRFLFVKQGRDLSKLTAYLKANKIERFTLIISPHSFLRKWDNASTSEFLKSIHITCEPRRLELKHASFLDVVLLDAAVRDASPKR